MKHTVHRGTPIPFATVWTGCTTIISVLWRVCTFLAAAFDVPMTLFSLSNTSMPSTSSLLRISTTLHVLAVAGTDKNYHWWELLQLSFLFFFSRQVLSWQNMYFVTIKVCLPRQNFCHDKITIVVTKYFCRDKSFVTTNICRDKHIFNTRVCHYKSKLVTTKLFLSRQKFCHDKNMFVMTKVLLQQAYFCRDKRHVLLQQKWYLWQLPPSIKNTPKT